MPTRLSQFRVFDPQHPHHYGSILFVGWALAIAGAIPGLAFPKLLTGWSGEALISIGPLAAHIYSLRALLALRHDKALKPNMMAALFTLSYLPVGIMAELILPWPMAFIIPVAGLALAIFSFGILFPGLGPLIAYGINTKWVRPHESRARLAIALSLFLIGWMLAGLTAELIASV